MFIFVSCFNFAPHVCIKGAEVYQQSWVDSKVFAVKLDLNLVTMSFHWDISVNSPLSTLYTEHWFPPPCYIRSKAAYAHIQTLCIHCSCRLRISFICSPQDHLSLPQKWTPELQSQSQASQTQRSESWRVLHAQPAPTECSGPNSS